MTRLFVASFLILASSSLLAQNIGINATGAAPDGSALLDISSVGSPNMGGLLIPRMTSTQRNSIASPATSLLLFNTTTDQFQYWDGANWQAFIPSGRTWSLDGNAGIDAFTDFIGTTDNQPLVFRTNSLERIRLSSAGFLGVGTTNPSRLLHLEENNVLERIGQLYVHQIGIGDALMHIGVGNSRHYNIGIDNSDFDKLKIGTATSVDASSTGTLLTLATNGNLGLGTTAPSRLLDLQTNNTATTLGQLYVHQIGTGDALMHIGVGNSRHYNIGIDNSDLDKLKIGTATSVDASSIGTLLTLDPAGRLGLGTTTPSNLLHLRANNTATSTGQLYVHQSGTGDALMHIGVNNRHYNIGVDNSDFDKLKIGTAAFAGASSIGTLLTLDSAGRLSLGTTTPSNLLHLQANDALDRDGQLYVHQIGAGDALMHIGVGNSRHYNIGIDNSDMDKLKIGTSSTSPTSVSVSTLFSLESSGALGLGTTTPDAHLEVAGASTQSVRITTTSGGTAMLELKRLGGSLPDYRIKNQSGFLTLSQSTDDLVTEQELFQFSTNYFRPQIDGSINLGEATHRWLTVFAVNGVINTSDVRDKTNINELTYGLAEVMRLRPVTYQWKEHAEDGTKIGLIAQELQEVIPEVVKNRDWSEPIEGEERKKVEADRLGVYYSDIIPVLIKSIQELKAENDRQQVLIEYLRKELER